MTGSFHLTQPTVTYRIYCTARCSGETSYRAFVMRRHAKAVRVSKLDLGPEPVSITTPTGGDEQFTQIYSGRVLHLFKALARAEGVLELRITGLSGTLCIWCDLRGPHWVGLVKEDRADE